MLDAKQGNQETELDIKALVQTKVAQSEKHIIAVDSREFSSHTPICLYEAGFWVIPMQLTVGDYILSDQVCIEKKSVSTGDLFESFKSGRLLQQVSNMNQFYKKPCLLIEFDEDIPFKLQDINRELTAGLEISAQSVISKISLLTLHFPNLQIIWSKSPKHTAEILMDMKKTLECARQDPDLMKIEKIGKVGKLEAISSSIKDLDLNAEDEEKEGKEDGESYGKLLPREFLKRIPGINSNNMPIVIKHCKNMMDLVCMPFDQLKDIIGAKNAKQVKSFLETKVDETK